MKQRIDWIDRLQYLGLRLASTLMHSWPVEANLAAAEGLGDWMYRLDRRHRERALGNLRRSLPHLTERQRERMARQSMRQLFLLFVEVMFTTRLIRIDTFARHVELGDFRQTLKLLMDDRRGLIMLTGHYGNWEVLGYVLATLGFRTVSVARPLDNPHVNAWLLGVRERQGQKIVDKKGATADVTDRLERAGTVCFIADQNAGKKGMFVDFFGRPASTYKSIALLAMRHEVPIVVGYARRLPGPDGRPAFKFQVGSQDVIHPEDWADEPDPLRYITQRYSAAIEAFVREDPGQYLWVHRRWKTRPKGEAPEAFD